MVSGLSFIVHKDSIELGVEIKAVTTHEFEFEVSDNESIASNRLKFIIRRTGWYGDVFDI